MEISTLFPETGIGDQGSRKIEKIIGLKQDENNQKLFLIKWEGLGYEENTWVPSEKVPQELQAEFQKNNLIPELQQQFYRHKIDYTKWSDVKINGLELKSYQIEASNFFSNAYCREQNVIFGDEKGLGRRISVLLFLKELSVNENINGPFLILAAKKKLEKWKKLLKLMDFNQVVIYDQPQIQITTIEEYELFYPGTSIPKTNIILSEFNSGVKSKALPTINWQCLFIDFTELELDIYNTENTNDSVTETFNLLSNFQYSFTIFILQNILEIKNIHFTDFCFKFLYRSLYSSYSSIFSKINERLKESIYLMIMHYHLFKRTKMQVSQNYNVVEYLIDCNLSEIQIGYYQTIYLKYFKYILQNFKGLFIQKIYDKLIKVCSHPYLIGGAEREILLSRTLTPFGEDEATVFLRKALIDVSGKMKMFDRITKYILEKKERVVIFCTREATLDLIQDHLNALNLFYQRIGNNVRGQEREDCVDQFNANESLDFAFLICAYNKIGDFKLKSVTNVIIFDSENDPKTAISNAFSIIENPKFKIFRLLTMRTIEYISYISSILKDKNNIELDNHELLSEILIFGSKTHENINNSHDYLNESIESIFDRSLKNVYNYCKDITEPHLELKTQNKQNNEIIIPIIYLQEKYDGGEIKGQIIQEYMQPNYMSPQIDINDFIMSKRLNNFWVLTKLDDLLTGLCNFGWGRWNSINEKLQIKGLAFEVEGLSYIFLTNLLQNAKQHHIIARSISENYSLSQDAQIFRNKFMELNLNTYILGLIKTNTDLKIFRLEFMTLINSIVSTCPEPPGKIVVPLIENTISDSWNEDADRALIYKIYQNGYMNFGQPIIYSPDLESRVKLLINTLKKQFIKYKEMRDQTAHFEHSYLVKAANLLTKYEQRQYIQALIYYGWTNKDDFRGFIGSHRAPQELEVFHHLIMDFCRGKTELISELAEGITFQMSQLLLKREALFFNLRNHLILEKIAPFEIPIFLYVRENGFINLDSCEEIVKKFGFHGLEYKVTQYISSFFQLPPTSGISIQRGISDKDYSTSEKNVKHRVVNAPEVNYDQNGEPILPIQLTPSLIIESLGTIVTDRPAFSNNRYIYPAGFSSLRQFRSILKPQDKVWYRSMIIDNGSPSPIFRVELSDDSSIHFDGTAPSKPWTTILKIINDKKDDLGLVKSKNVTVSGPEYYGLASPIVLSLIQRMKGSEQCPTSLSGNVLDISQPKRASSSPKSQDDSGQYNNDDENEDEKEDAKEDNGKSEYPDTKIHTRIRNKKVKYTFSSSTDFESDESETLAQRKEFTNEENQENDDDFELDQELEENIREEDEKLFDEEMNDDSESGSENEVIEPENSEQDDKLKISERTRKKIKKTIPTLTPEELQPVPNDSPSEEGCGVQ